MLKDKKNLANLITFSRIIGVVFIFWALPYKNSFIQTWIIIIYTITCLTDFLDGWAARHYSLTSDLGKIIDPLADKLLILIFLPLIPLQAISALPVFIILGREFAIMGLRIFAAKQNIIIEAKLSGKIKTGITLPVLGILLGRIPSIESNIPLLLKPLHMLILWVQSWPNWCFETLIWITVTVTIWSFFDYTAKFLSQKQPKKQKLSQKKWLCLIPNIVTLLNLSCGILAVLHALIQNLGTSCALILIGCILDACDGIIARKLNVKSKFGEQLDTSTDLITFGVAPAILIYSFLVQQNTSTHIIFGSIFGICHFCAIFYRLRRFSNSGHSHFFQGIPAPAGASIVVFTTAATTLSSPTIFYILMIINQALSVSKLPYPHNSYSYTKILFAEMRYISFVFWLLQIAQLLDIPIPKTWPLAEINLGLMCIYLASPIWPNSKQKNNPSL
ncbi:MAG: CDP-diacylglycerol--glycerol-3-phosphate 3-phosphatidyltransferase [bacterium]